MNYARTVVERQPEVGALISELEARGDMDDFVLLQAAQEAYSHYFLGTHPMVRDPKPAVAKVWEEVKALSDKFFDEKGLDISGAEEAVAKEVKPKKVVKRKKK